VQHNGGCYYCYCRA